MNRIITWGVFDTPGAGRVAELYRLSLEGKLTVLLASDGLALSMLGKPPVFSLEERRYFLEALRYVDSVRVYESEEERHEYLSFAEGTPVILPEPSGLGFPDGDRESGVPPRGDEIAHSAVSGLVQGQRKRPLVMVTGSFDLLHTGHIRFFEEAAELGNLVVVVGHDANIGLLKGPGHPLVRERMRRFMVASIRHVDLALVSSGSGWLDAEPEILELKPDLYVVNSDGDKGGKREYCEAHGIGYRVLERKPRTGLPARSSTELKRVY